MSTGERRNIHADVGVLCKEPRVCAHRLLCPRYMPRSARMRDHARSVVSCLSIDVPELIGNPPIPIEAADTF